jgi:hypothetical protein
MHAVGTGVSGVADCAFEQSTVPYNYAVLRRRMTALFCRVALGRRNLGDVEVRDRPQSLSHDHHAAWLDGLRPSVLGHEPPRRRG